MANYSKKLNLYLWEAKDEKLRTFQELNANVEKLEEAMVTEQDLPYTKKGNAAAFLSSLYLGNDHNLFAYMSDGEYANLATMEQNDIAKLGDFNIPRLWIAARDYASFRTKKLEIVREWNEDGTAKVPARELYDVGNFCNHAIVQSNGTQTLTKGSKNKLSILGNIITAFPIGNFAANKYTIPRTGVYEINIIAKVTADLTVANSYLRFGFFKTTGGVETDIDMMDEALSSSYATPFVGVSFMYQFNKGDVVQPFINPLNENVTIGAGTKFNIFFKGDTPSS
ncbi:hypothetical protein B5V89_16505 [Heyndrickxia sporothermodurans]|uniref:hypothetical protein n=1 Tax=Heyndrickxia TaxID=2837504 RepID=UPI000D33CA58|nr:hypothetical protein [Heyndrickxia sporothermodurans]PTY76929.1 hypothetical protein B5V89_16505 [Heyndrickxia sporothermodurans]